jgi:hypothetical protein
MYRNEATKNRICAQVKLIGRRYRKDSYKAKKAGIEPIRCRIKWGPYSHRVYGETTDKLTPKQIKFNKVCCDAYKSFEGAANPDAYHRRTAPRKRKR